MKGSQKIYYNIINIIQRTPVEFLILPTCIFKSNVLYSVLSISTTCYAKAPPLSYFVPFHHASPQTSPTGF